MPVLDAPQAPTLEYDLDAELRGLLELHEKTSDRVIVQVYMPWVTAYNRDFDPHRDLVYGPPPEPIAVGDIVLCPASPKHPSPFQGIVIDLDGDKHPYKGPVKSLLKKVR